MTINNIDNRYRKQRSRKDLKRLSAEEYDKMNTMDDKPEQPENSAEGLTGGGNAENTPMEYSFPLSDYYKGNIVSGETLTNTGVWWTAILVIKDPKTQKPFVGMYRWQKTKEGWKTRKRFTFKRREEIARAISIIQRLAVKIEP